MNINILLETKNEYSEEIITSLTPYIKKHFLSIYSDVKSKNKNHRYILKEFQTGLSVISKWTEDDKQNVHDTISKKINWLDDLINAFFVTKSKIIASANHIDQQVTMVFETATEFIHKCFLKTARELWKRPDLLYDRVSKVEHQKNLQQLEELIRVSIAQTIRDTFQIREIFRMGTKRQVQKVESTENCTLVEYKPDDQDTLLEDMGEEDDEISSEEDYDEDEEEEDDEEQLDEVDEIGEQNDLNNHEMEVWNPEATLSPDMIHTEPDESETDEYQLEEDVDIMQLEKKTETEIKNLTIVGNDNILSEVIEDEEVETNDEPLTKSDHEIENEFF